MLYHYFGNKRDLFLAVLEHIYEEIRRKEEDLHLEEASRISVMVSSPKVRC